jgi:hypothetical protein
MDTATMSAGYDSKSNSGETTDDNEHNTESDEIEHTDSCKGNTPCGPLV